LTMATPFSALGQPTSDLLSDVFPEEENKFETEVNSKASCGSKVQVLLSKVRDGSGLLATFKPTYPFTFGSIKGELKAQLSTDGKTAVDTSLGVSAVEGLKLKLGTTNISVTGGFDYSNQFVNTNVQLEFPIKGEAPTLKAASVFVHGNYSLGASVVHNLGNSGAAPDVEGKVGLNFPDNNLIFNVARKKSNLTLGLSFLHRLSETRSLGSKLEFVPGQLSHANLIVVTSNKVNDDTVVKARFDTSRSALAFGVSNALNQNLTLEYGTDFRADLSGSSVYNLKLIYNS